MLIVIFENQEQNPFNLNAEEYFCKINKILEILSTQFNEIFSTQRTRSDFNDFCDNVI